MKRISYADLSAELQRVQRSESMLSVVLNLVLNGKPDATERVTVQSGESYTLKLYGAKRADGGTVLVTFKCKGQSPHTAAYLLDDMHARPVGTQDLAIACAVDRLTIARNRLAGYKI